MNKKRLITVISAAVVFAVIVGILYMQFGYERLEKTVAVRGYEIMVPKNWSTDSKGNLYDRMGNLAGAFTLVDEDSVTSGSEIADDVTKSEITQGDRKAVLYYVRNLPNPEPYAASIVLYKDTVKDKLATKIYESFKIPAIGTNPPQKNISAPVLTDITDDKICRVEFADGTVTVKNLKLLNIYMERQKEKQSTGVDVLSYKEEEGVFVLESWYHIESDKGTGYMYTYYDKGDGLYTYDNNPLVFESVTKEMAEDKGITSYRLTSAGVNTTTLLEIPLNLYRDNAEELIALKTMSATETEIQNILNKIKTKKELNALTFKVDKNTLLITYEGSIEPDSNKAYSDAAVLFSLASNLHKITFTYGDGTMYTFTRDKVKNTLSTNMDSAAENKENFVDYTEEIENIQHNQAQDGDVVYSGTVVISYNTMVTHPDTGERVEVGPYAERKGYGQYLGKPINCVIKRMGNAYIASASSGGTVIGSYPLNSEAELQNAISLIKAYS